MDLNIYNLNFVVCLFGKPKDVMYYANIEKGIDTSGVLILDYEKFKCVCIAAKDCKAPINSTIQGDKGYVYISSPVNVLSGFGIVHNDQSKQVLSNVNELENYNENHHRMHYVFKEITEMIDNKDLDYCGKMQEISLITMEIQTKARKMAKIVFPND